MGRPCVSYVCVRPEHHRRQKGELALTTHNGCCAFCPAAAADGHDWLAVPEVTLETFEALGWIPLGAARRCAERASTTSASLMDAVDRELTAAGR